MTPPSTPIRLLLLTITPITPFTTLRPLHHTTFLLPKKALHIFPPPGSGYQGPEDSVSELPDTYEPTMEYPGTMRPGRHPENVPFHDLPIGDDDPDPVPWPHFQQIEWHHQWGSPGDDPTPMEDYIEELGRWATVEDEAEMRKSARRGVRERREAEMREKKPNEVVDDTDEDDDVGDVIGDVVKMTDPLGLLSKAIVGGEGAVADVSENEEEDLEGLEEEDDIEDDDDFLLELGLDADEDEVDDGDIDLEEGDDEDVVGVDVGMSMTDEDVDLDDINFDDDDDDDEDPNVDDNLVDDVGDTDTVPLESLNDADELDDGKDVITFDDGEFDFDDSDSTDEW